MIRVLTVMAAAKLGVVPRVLSLPSRTQSCHLATRQVRTEPCDDDELRDGIATDCGDRFCRSCIMRCVCELNV